MRSSWISLVVGPKHVWTASAQLSGRAHSNIICFEATFITRKCVFVQIRRTPLYMFSRVCTHRPFMDPTGRFWSAARPTTAGRRGALPVHAPRGLRASTSLDPRDLLRQPSTGLYVCSPNVSIYGPRIGAMLGVFVRVLYVFVRVCTCLYVCTFLYVFVRVCTCLYVVVRFCTGLNVFARVCTFLYALYLFVRVCALLYVSVCVCTY
jgi:hypothetical protein